ncbi:MAG: Na+/H+ antiporter NhaA [Gammaproteobacteria bacterium]|nr:Na+/H+ antiporter NhaA [Gammaproteobacteria bacterium]
MGMVGRFLKLESASGILLFIMALLALILCNSPWAHGYQKIWQVHLAINVGHYAINGPLLFWVNEGLMAWFFLSVGLELKYEFLEGHLASLSQVMLPAVSALGGMIVPSIVYCLINYHHAAALNGWAVPVATDIAFALGVLSLFGKRVPSGLKLFLMALAIFDDVGAIIIIAIFHTDSLSYLSLGFAVLFILTLQLLNMKGVRRLSPYLLVGVLLWFCVLKSGVHATVAGVLLAFMIPLHKKEGEAVSPLKRLQVSLHPWIAFFVMPLFAFANAGVSFSGLTTGVLMGSVVMGVALGLLVGKQVGVFLFAWLMVRLKLARLPKDTTWLALYGVAIICGIGFTMSLFLGTLAFEEASPALLVEVRLGVLMGSLLAGVIGAMVLQRAFSKKAPVLGVTI